VAARTTTDGLSGPALNHRRKSRSEALLARSEPVPGGDTGCKGFKRLEPRTSRSGRVPTSPGEEECHRLHPVSQFESSSAGHADVLISIAVSCASLQLVPLLDTPLIHR